MSKFKEYVESASFNLKLSKEQITYILKFDEFPFNYVRNPFMTIAALQRKGILEPVVMDGFSTDYPYSDKVLGPNIMVRQCLTEEGKKVKELIDLVYK